MLAEHELATGNPSNSHANHGDTVLESGRALDNGQVRERLREIVASAKEEWGISDPERVGIGTATRYLAEKSLLQGLGGRNPAGGNHRGTLTDAFCTPALKQAHPKEMRWRKDSHAMGASGLNGLLPCRDEFDTQPENGVERALEWTLQTTASLRGGHIGFSVFCDGELQSIKVFVEGWPV